MDTTKELRTVAFCAGYAGIERGLEMAGQPCRVVAYSEIEAFAVANLVAKMETGALDTAPVWTNLKTFPMEVFRGKVDFLTGGFPCQPFSAAGARGADEDPRHLFPHFKRFAETVKPRFVFLENVDGIASAKLGGDNWSDPKGTPVLLHVCRELERVGYRVAAGCFSAREVGAPHKRRRWFILGELADIDDRNRGSKQEREYKESPQEFCGGAELADTCSEGLQGSQQCRTYAERRSLTHGAASKCGYTWPAPPGPYQHEWEEPRTVADVEPMVRSETSGRGGNGQACDDPTKSELGRAIDGPASGVDPTANRVDRLRLCGNGVVPQTAAVAWITLLNKLGAPK